MKRFSALVLLLLSVIAAAAQSADDLYVQIYSGIQGADTLYDNAQAPAALAKYIELQDSLKQFQKGYPEWNPNVVRFRLDYLARRIEEIRSKLGGSGATPTAPTATPPPDPVQLERQINVLSEQVRQLQADKTVLQAKLREALAIQPATADPRELAKAEERIKELQKQNDLLQVVVDQAKTKPATADPKELEQLKSQLTKETERSAALEKQAQELKKELEKDGSQSKNNASAEKMAKELNAANQQVAEQKALLARLQTEKEALEKRVQEPGKDADALAALKVENELLKQQLAKKGPGTADASGSDLAQTRAQLATLQSERDTLKLEKTALETRIKQLQDESSKPAITPFASAPKEDNKATRQLERENKELQGKLEKANKQLAALSKKRGQGDLVQQLQREVSSLNSRLEALEAQKVPYSDQELALMKGSGTPPATEARKPAAQLPPGAADLVAEAQRLFAARQFDKAEEKYQEVLKKDENNPITLANLASIQLEAGKIPEAERNASKALEQAPDDTFSLQVLGQIKVKQHQYDAAFDYLSRAAKLDPNSPSLQNSLGLVLSEKGMRAAAETALRKAIQLQPNYAEAHNNLAVVYVTQKPPMVELARWHYQKAIAAGGSNPSLLKLIEEAEKNAAAK